MNKQALRKMGDSLRVNFMAGRALMAIRAAQQGQDCTANDRYKVALEEALEFMRHVNKGRDVFKGKFLGASALRASRAYDTALRAVETTAGTLLLTGGLSETFTDIEHGLERLLNSKAIGPQKLELLRDFFSLLMKSASVATRQAMEESSELEVPRWHAPPGAKRKSSA